MKKKKLLKKLQACQYEKEFILEEMEYMREELEQYSYSIERKKSLTHDERFEMLLVEAEKSCKAYKNGGNLTDFYVAQTRLFAQKCRDANVTNENRCIKLQISA